MQRKSRFVIVLAIALTLFVGQSALAQDEWKFGIGTGFRSLALDGDLGFDVDGSPALGDVDLDNSDTADRFKSAFGLGGYAAKGKWRILYSGGILTLEDDDAGIDAEWDRTQVEVAGVYNFAKTGKQNWGVLFGGRYIKHDWDIVTFDEDADLVKVDFDDDWTDALIGVTHAVPFAAKWVWSSRLDAGFGGSEGSFNVRTGANWMLAKKWTLLFSVGMMAIDYENGDPGDSDWYKYDIDETTLGVAFTYNF